MGSGVSVFRQRNTNSHEDRRVKDTGEIKSDSLTGKEPTCNTDKTESQSQKSNTSSARLPDKKERSHLQQSESGAKEKTPVLPDNFKLSTKSNGTLPFNLETPLTAEEQPKHLRRRLPGIDQSLDRKKTGDRDPELDYLLENTLYSPNREDNGLDTYVKRNLDYNPKLEGEYDIDSGGEAEDIVHVDDLDRNPHLWWKMWHQNPRMSMSFTSSKGLLNAPGANNCFLNSAVQVLWHLDVFRRNFRQLSGHSCMGNSCIFCAVKVIFTQFQYSDQSVLPPDALRKALAKTFHDQQRFQMGLMDDAAECFENILMRIHSHLTDNHSEDMCSAAHCIPHQKFSQTVVEQVVCPCGFHSEPHSFSQMVQYVSTNALCDEARLMRQKQGGPIPDHLFGPLLKKAFSRGNDRKCPEKNCGATVNIRRNLTNCPDVLSLGLIWDSDHPSVKLITEVIQAIGPTLRLPDLFDTCVDERWAQSSELALVGVVCYYGKHYSTFFLHSKLHQWISFDDANVKQMGSWAQVADKCCRGHYQPLLLLYANPHSSAVDTSTAPACTTMVPGYSFSNDPRQGPEQQQVSNHNRQGSASSVDRTLRPGGQKQYYNNNNNSHGAKPQRSRTPNPDDMLRSDISTELPERRAMTPGPEWGRYESDDEDKGCEKKTGSEHTHFRQSSYLTAMEELSREMEAHSQTQPFDANIGSYNVNKAAYSSAMKNNYGCDSVDGGQRYAQSGYNSNSSNPVSQSQGYSGYYNQQNYVPQQGYSQQGYSQTGYSKFQQNSYTQQNSYPTQGHSQSQGYPQQGQSQNQGYPQQGQSQNKGYPQQGQSQNIAYSQQGYSNQNSFQQTQGHGMQTQAYPQQAFPDQSRRDARSQNTYPSSTQTYGDTLQSSQNGPSAGQKNYNASQIRPQSAQPQSSHAQGHYDLRPSSAHSQGHTQGHYDPRLSQPASNKGQSPTKPDPRNMPSKEKWNDLNEEDSYGTYINTKAVEKVLGMQGKNSRNRTTSANYAHVEISTAKPNPKVDIYSLNATKTGLVKGSLSVDTGDSDSHKDSGYRSGGSSGDRNSSSSNSVSIDSPSDSNKPYGYNHLKYPQASNQHLSTSHSNKQSSQHNQQHQHSYQPAQHNQQPAHGRQPPPPSNYPTRHQNYTPAVSMASRVSTKRPVGVDAKSYSSTESLSSSSANAGSLGAVNTLSTRPTPIERGSVAASRGISKSQESLAVIEDNTKPVKDLVKQLDTKVMGGQIQVQQNAAKAAQKAKPPTPQRTTSTLSSASSRSVPSNQSTGHSNQPNSAAPSNGPTDSLYIQADGLMEMSRKKESQGDLHTALAKINQAIGCLQQLLSQASTSSETLVHVRATHNSAVLRSRALLHSIQQQGAGTARQHSNSTVSSDDVSSLSSMSTDVSDGKSSHSSREPVVQPHRQHYTHNQPNTAHPQSSSQQQLTSRHPGSSHAHSSKSSLTSDRPTAKTMEFPKPVSANIVTTREDFPHLSRRRKFMSDYVSREDYFSHHPPPRNYTGVAGAVHKVADPQRAQDCPAVAAAPKPCPPPKPAVQPKPKLKHSISTEKQTKVYPDIDETGGINIYATLPRRPKNRERSSTLGSNQQAEVYQAYLNSKRQKDVPNQRGSEHGQEGYDRCRQTCYNQPVSGSTNHVTGLTSSMAGHARMGSREDLVSEDYVSRTAGESDEHNLSIESMVTQQINQLTLTKSNNGVKNSHPYSSQSQGHSRSQGQRQGPVIQRVMPQQSVNPTSQLPVYPHPPMYQGRQSSVESQSSNESSGSQLSKLEAHQMALMHPRDGPGSQQMKFPQKHELRKSSSNNQITHSSATNTHSSANVKLVQSPKKSKHMGGQRTGSDQHLARSESHETTEREPFEIDLRVNECTSKHSKNNHVSQRLRKSGSNSQLDSTDVSDFSHMSSVPLSQGRHCDSLDTLVNEESCFTSCVVVDGCEYVFEKSPAEMAHQTSHVTIADLVEKESTDQDLQDFCIIEQAAKTKVKEPSDCSSSSGIERTDTQSDTSSYTSRTKETKSVLVKKKKQKGFKARKNVTFSDKVALVSTAPEEEVTQQPPDYIAYVQALLKRSPGKHRPDAEAGGHDAVPGTPMPPRSGTPVAGEASPSGKSGYDSDFDEETDDSCASDDMASSDKVQCNLCRKRLIDATHMFCHDCSYYMAQFAPTAS